MKKIFTGVILGMALAGVSLAQAPSRAAAVKSGKPRIAVVEFTPGPNASVMTAEAKRHLQASIAFSLFSSRKYDVVDVRQTRAASGDPSAINSGSTSAAVKLGKQLGVSYVLTGVVTEYDTRAGQARLKVRFVEVATGKVRYSGEIAEQSISAMTARAGEAEMMAKVLKPCIEKLTAALIGV